MLLGIDHLVIAVADPDEAIDLLAPRLGVRPSDGGRHGKLGTFNRLLWLGDSFIELIGVFDRARAMTSWIGAPTVRALDTGGGFATWAIASDDLSGDVQALRDAGSSVADPVTGERERPDGNVVRWRLVVPGVLGATEPPFLIEHDPMSAEWTEADRASRATEPGRLRGIELTVPDAVATAARFERVIGLRWRRDHASPTLETTVGPHHIRLIEAPAAHAVRIDVGGGSAPKGSFDLLGCAWTVSA